MLKANINYYITDDERKALFSSASEVTMYFNGKRWDFGVYTHDGLFQMLPIKPISTAEALKISNGLAPKKLYRMLGIKINKKIRTKKSVTL